MKFWECTCTYRNTLQKACNWKMWITDQNWTTMASIHQSLKAKNSFYFQFWNGRANSLTCCQFMEMLRNQMEESQNCCHIVMIPQKKISFNVLSFSYSEQGMNPAPKNPTVTTSHCTDYTTKCIKKGGKNPRHTLRFKQWEGNFLGGSFAPWKNRMCNPDHFHWINNSQGRQMLENHHVAWQNHNIQRMYCKNDEQILPVLKSFNSLFPLPCSLFSIVKWHHLFWLNIT